MYFIIHKKVKYQPDAVHCWMKVSLKERQPYRSWAVRIYPPPATFFESSVLHAAGRPTLHLSNRGLRYNSIYLI